MNKKDRRIKLFLEFFFLVTGVYIIGNQVWKFYAGTIPTSIFEVYNARIPVFTIFSQCFAGLASFIAGWSLWARASWSTGWCMFTLGLLIYHNVYALGSVIHSRPAASIPMVIIILVALQSFPFLIRNTRRFR